jgi:hypothetical protein
MIPDDLYVRPEGPSGPTEASGFCGSRILADRPKRAKFG